MSEQNATVPGDEWATRVDLAALYRLAVHYGWTDVTSTHISARIPGDRDHYLLISHDLMSHDIRASNLVKTGFDGSRDREDGAVRGRRNGAEDRFSCRNGRDYRTRLQLGLRGRRRNETALPGW